MAWVTLALVMGAAASVACAVYYAFAAVRVMRMRRMIPTARHGLALAAARTSGGGAWARVCIVVPAHNEERMIGNLVRSLAAQEYPGGLRVVLALDRCTDGTERAAGEAIAGDERFEIVRIGECPDGWAGKVHAIHRGVRDAQATRDAEILVFLDADTELEARCIAGAVALLEERKVDLLSFLCTLTSDAWWERVAQPAAGIELVRRFPLDRLNREDGRIPFANGQFMMFRREAYDEIGGHEAVRGELLEDLALAAKIVHHKRDRRLSVLMGDGMIGCRMYESMTEFRRGWKRIFGESMRRDAARLRGAAIRLVIIGCAMPLAAAATMIAGVAIVARGEPGAIAWMALGAGAMGVVSCGIALAQMYAAQGLARWWVIAYPLGAWIAAGIEREAARDLDAGVKTEWGGKQYARGGGDA